MSPRTWTGPSWHLPHSGNGSQPPSVSPRPPSGVAQPPVPSKTEPPPAAKSGEPEPPVKPSKSVPAPYDEWGVPQTTFFWRGILTAYDVGAIAVADADSQGTLVRKHSPVALATIAHFNTPALGIAAWNVREVVGGEKAWGPFRFRLSDVEGLRSLNKAVYQNELGKGPAIAAAAAANGCPITNIGDLTIWRTYTDGERDTAYSTQLGYGLYRYAAFVAWVKATLTFNSTSGWSVNAKANVSSESRSRANAMIAWLWKGVSQKQGTMVSALAVLWWRGGSTLAGMLGVAWSTNTGDPALLKAVKASSAAAAAALQAAIDAGVRK